MAWRLGPIYFERYVGYIGERVVAHQKEGNWELMGQTNWHLIAEPEFSNKAAACYTVPWSAKLAINAGVELDRSIFRITNASECWVSLEPAVVLLAEHTDLDGTETQSSLL
ncbi:hypothetical protein J6590_003258 [Homalodisca vitripennis]|nr:hypothetical protein J6590_003258 [Homalodisca vitripennis]